MERGCIRDYQNNTYLPRSCWGELVWVWLYCTELTNEKPSLAHTLYFFSEVLVRKTNWSICDRFQSLDESVTGTQEMAALSVSTLMK